MNNVDLEYNRLVNLVLKKGKWKNNRTGVKTLAYHGLMFEHDMTDGFPILTTRFIPFKSIRVELEGFIKGITNKTWYQERGCYYWDNWCNPKKIAYNNDNDTKQKMLIETDLGKIYGYQWRNFNSSGIDQLKNVINTLLSNPDDRRMLVSAWNPCELNEMALPPCHFGWQLTVIDGRLNLAWFQRSVDYVCGFPSNLASYALLLHLLAKISGFKEGRLTGHLVDVHLYENHLENLTIQLSREPYKLPVVETLNINTLFDWDHEKSKLIDYKFHPKLKFDVAV